jgi:hypothetical protein
LGKRRCTRKEAEENELILKDTGDMDFGDGFRDGIQIPEPTTEDW